MRIRLSPSSFAVACLFAGITLLLFPSPSYATGFWSGFQNYWFGFFKQQNGIVMAVLVIGAASIFIVTRGKWRK